MQNPLELAGLQTLLQGAGLTRLIARHREVMGDLVAGSPRHRQRTAKLLDVGGIRRNDAVIGVHNDTRLGQTVEERKQFAQEVGCHVSFVAGAKMECHHCPRSHHKHKPRLYEIPNQLIYIDLIQQAKQAHILIMTTLETGDARCPRLRLQPVFGQELAH
jgi:hypothetical protein